MTTMDPRRLELLLELSRLGSMREVAEVMHVTTSTVSQQIAVLSREAGTQLIEADGRRVRLTPAGRRLADHAVTVLAALEAARLDLDPSAEPAGTVRVAAFATAVRQSLMPVVRNLAVSHPDVRLQILEHEPAECLDLLAADDIDLALTYDFDLAPASFDATLEPVPLWEAEWGLGVPAADPVVRGQVGRRRGALPRQRLDRELAEQLRPRGGAADRLARPASCRGSCTARTASSWSRTSSSPAWASDCSRRPGRSPTECACCRCATPASPCAPTP